MHLSRPVLVLSLFLSACTAAESENGARPGENSQACKDNALALQVLGSGGPIADDHRAGSSNIVWVDGKARVLVDAGAGSFVRYGQSGAAFQDHIAILLTHFHGDHVGGLPALLNSGGFSGRTESLLIAGPESSDNFPSTSGFLEAIVGKTGALPYLSPYLDDDPALPKLIIRDIVTSRDYLQAVHRMDDIDIDAIAVHHLEVPALAYVIRTKGKRILFSGDQSFLSEAFVDAVRNGRPDIMLMHNAISMADGQPRGLHRDGRSMGEAAQAAGAKKLVLTHHMQRALDDREAVVAAIRENYEGPIEFADDLSCYTLIDRTSSS